MSALKMGCAAAAVLAAAGMAGCATEGEPEFGSSVRHMITGQAYNPSAPESNAAGSVDGEKAGIAVKNYRSDKKGAQPGPASVLVIPTQ